MSTGSIEPITSNICKPLHMDAQVDQSCKVVQGSCKRNGYFQHVARVLISMCKICARLVYLVQSECFCLTIPWISIQENMITIIC